MSIFTEFYAQLVGNVIERVDKNKYKIQVRNRIIAPEVELELIRPHCDPIKFRVEHFFNIKTEEYEEIVHPNTIAILETDIEMGPLDLLRVKLPEGVSDTDIDISETTQANDGFVPKSACQSCSKDF